MLKVLLEKPTGMQSSESRLVYTPFGRWRVKTVPLPGFVSTLILPPCTETICLQIERPNPVPEAIPSEGRTR